MFDVPLSELLDVSAALVVDWSRAALPFYGPAGSMDLDLESIPDASGPSYYNQFAHWPLLMAAEGLVPGASDGERSRLRECALGNIEYLLRITDADFMTPHHSLGRDWGRHVGEWSVYYLMKSLLLMRAHGVGATDLHERLERDVRGAVERIHASFRDEHGPGAARPVRFPGNHAAWHALLLAEAGMRFGRPEWTELGSHFFRTRVLPYQLPSGCWPEGGGIVVNYSMVTAQALSIYADLTGDAAATEALARYLSFLRFFTYPDGSSAVVADCRQRYHPRPMVFIPPLLLRSPEGRRDGLRRIRGFHAFLGREGVRPLGVQGLAFFANVVDFLLRERGDPVVPIAARSVSGIDAARLGAGPWTVFVSWQLVEETPSRWILDAQNYLEIHHAGAGYLVGGGNSKYAPRFSTLRRRNAGRAYVPQTAKPALVEPTRADAVYEFGRDRVELSVEAADHAVDVRFRVRSREEAGSVYEGALMLDVRPGERLRCDEREYVIDPAAMVEHVFASVGTVTWRGRALRVPAGSVLSYPVVPHNPYRQDGLPSPEAYAGRISVEIPEGGTAFRVE